jgi:hypothetical protein
MISFVESNAFENLKIIKDEGYDSSLSFIDKVLYPSKLERKKKDLVYKSMYESTIITEEFYSPGSESPEDEVINPFSVAA